MVFIPDVFMYDDMSEICCDSLFKIRQESIPLIGCYLLPRHLFDLIRSTPG